MSLFCFDHVPQEKTKKNEIKIISVFNYIRFSRHAEDSDYTFGIAFEGVQKLKD